MPPEFVLVAHHTWTDFYKKNKLGFVSVQPKRHTQGAWQRTALAAKSSRASAGPRETVLRAMHLGNRAQLPKSIKYHQTIPATPNMLKSSTQTRSNRNAIFFIHRSSFIIHSTQSATNTFVSCPPPLLRLEQKAIFLPSGENIAKELKILSLVICSGLPVPSALIMYSWKS